MPIHCTLPILLHRALLPVLVILMPASCHPRVTACRLTQRTALCDNGQLQNIPNTLPEHIEEIFLNENLLQIIQDGSLSRYPWLRSLSFAKNLLKTVESKVFSHTPLIESLNLADNELHHGYQQVGQSLHPLSKLRNLDLSGNKLTEDMACDLLQNLSSLEYLSLSNNLLLRLDESTFSSLYQLKELNLEKNLLYEIDGAFDHLKKLRRLNLAFNFLPCLWRFEMTQLLVLNVSHNAIEWFISNQDLKETFELETLDLSHNHLLFFPFLPTHSVLRTLLLSHNRISFFGHLANKTLQNSTSSVRFYNLKGSETNVTVDLWDDSLHGDLSSVELLDLSGNQVGYFPHGFIKKMPHLYWLRLRTNCLESLNLTAEELPATLYELDVSNNRLTELRGDHSSAKEMNNLTHLNISLNNIQQLPARVFTTLPRLSAVDISYNSVDVCYPGEYSNTTLSDCAVWSNIGSLKQLYMAGCSLARLPPSPFDGTHLTHLELSNNPDLDLSHGSLRGLEGTLQHLGLGNTGLQNFDFSPYRQLRSLNISKNFLSNLPESMSHLKLKLLDVRDNKLNTISTQLANVLAYELETLFVQGNIFNCCRLDWYKKFKETRTVHIIDVEYVMCLDVAHMKHSLAHLNSVNCGSNNEESIWWFILLFTTLILSLVGIFVIYILTFRPKVLPKAIKKKCWRPTSY
ncbi:transforming growth factor beta activator LRRC33 [Chanos chanos]|uniref:Transforming growth factor beta activator LRRC33 n=1 Tax=Chanos chanos TaxID=29144 RepID=A0A6J2UXD4_CHACN|nr:transforming growth factor beta activator LRRC33 [Chanos chanos]